MMAQERERQDFVANNVTYNDAYDVYRRGLLEQQKAWIDDKVVPVVSKKIRKNDVHFRVLAVGSGYGDIDIILILALVKEIEKETTKYTMDYTVVERNAVFVDRFRARVREKNDAFANVKFNFVVGTLEESGSEIGNQKFDFIHLIHVLYYMDAEKMLQVCVESYLNSQGIILAVVQAEAGIYAKIWRHFSKSMKQHMGFFNLICEKEMKDLAQKIGLKYTIEATNRVMDVTDIVIDAVPNAVGSKLLDFFFHADQLNKSLQKNELKEIVDFFKMNTELQGGRYIGIANETIIFIYNL